MKKVLVLITSMILVVANGFPLNPSYTPEAVREYKVRADAGDPEAQYLYSSALSSSGVAKDQSMCFIYAKKATDQGYERAFWRVGLCYEKGWGVESNAVTAVAFYSRFLTWARGAANQGDIHAQRLIGNCYILGCGVEKDEVEAVRWYRKAADQGDTDAQCNLGFCFEQGRGVGKDEAEAVRWYRKAADQGHARAKNLLEERERVRKLITDIDERNKTTFCIKGFYLGMSFNDARLLLMYYFPKARIQITTNTADGFDKGLVINGMNMHFCDSDKNGKVKRLNFLPQILNQWFDYPGVSSTDWLKSFAREQHLDFRFEEVVGTKECSSPFFGNGQVFGASEIHQETYVHRDRRGFSLRYFGSKRSYDRSPFLTHGGDPQLAGAIAAGRKVAREWYKDGWENDKGGAEGALRLEETTGAATGDEWTSR